ncbi:hypothetical protein MNB_SM-5-301 [hydrothermal vent metagenome]|uniref:Uncharacterized protein n=1 Tax=hydrothermal vent metagenome TaxID=652676 RepID=A0A1W1CY88_9ZZZZ
MPFELPIARSLPLDVKAEILIGSWVLYFFIEEKIRIL